jgi:hypothetical protein
MQYSLSNKKLDSAKWFIDAIRQRQKRFCYHECHQYHEEFFLDGMKPS